MADARIPILLAEPMPITDVVHVWCCYCHEIHFHDLEESGQNKAGCAPDSGSPFLETGYFIYIRDVEIEDE